jgi:hypothetical protein
VPSKLSIGQVNALLRFGADQAETEGRSGVIDGILYAHNGVSQPTAGILVQRGLAMWTHESVSELTGPRQGIRIELDWGIELTPAGWAKLFELNPSARTR